MLDKMIVCFFDAHKLIFHINFGFAELFSRPSNEMH